MAGGVQVGARFVPHAAVMMHAAQAAAGFHGLGVRKADSVALMLRNDVPFLEGTMGARILGAYPVPINWHLRGEEVAYILKDSGAKVLVVHSDLLRQIKEIVPPGLIVIGVAVDPDLVEAYGVDPAHAAAPAGTLDWDTWLAGQPPWSQPPEAEVSSMIYTSGTTGRQKGVRRQAPTPEQYAQTVQQYCRVLGVGPDLRTIIPAPLYHSAPNAAGVLATQLGGFVVLMPKFDPEAFLALVEEHRITHVQMVPVMFIRLLKLPEEVRAKYDVRSLSYIVHAAAPCPPEVKKAMIEWWGPIIHEYYGSTEVGAVTFCNSEEALANMGTVGRAYESAIVKVLGADGIELPRGEIGTVYTRLPWVPDFTYQGDDAKRRSVEMAGLITSGDVGYMNDAGFLFLCDRANDMVISGGVNIYPAEIEAVLITMPGVRDCAVFGIPDDEYGEALAAVIQPQDGAALDAAAVIGYLKPKLAGFKIPRVVEFRADLPREDSGKLFKRKLREPYWEGRTRRI